VVESGDAKTSDGAAKEGGTVYVTYLPYLPLRERVKVGEWELIPRGELVDADALDARAPELALGLADLYELPPGAGQEVGVFGRREGGRVGDDPHERTPMGNLQRSLVAPVLNVTRRSEQGGQTMVSRTLTSDNAMVITHGIDRGTGSTAVVSGGRLVEISAGYPVIPDPDYPWLDQKFAPPPDLRVGYIGYWDLDFEYADAVSQSTSVESDEARRLARAVDWLDFAGRNTTSLTDDLRVPALQAGFEVLLDRGDSRSIAGVRIGRVLSDLLTPDAPRAERSWRNRSGRKTTCKLTDLAWWFLQFSFLRNALMHGDAPTEEDWAHDGVSHVDLGELRLGQAIKETVARDGHPDLRKPQRDREFERRWKAAIAKYEGGGEEGHGVAGS
jgi:hypothetical protein